jgi:hypothetical protein
MGDGLSQRAWGPGRPFKNGRLGNPGRRIGCRNGAVETDDFDRHLHSSKRPPAPGAPRAACQAPGQVAFNFEEIFCCRLAAGAAKG